MSKIKYEELIDEMGKDAFDLLVKQLRSTKTMKLFYLKKKDLRREDVIEKIYQMEDDYYSLIDDKKPDRLEYYTGFLKNYLKMINTQESGRASKFLTRGLNIVDKLNKEEEDSMEDVKDLVKIFICLMREYFPFLDVAVGRDSKCSVEDITFQLNKSKDLVLLNEIRKYPFKDLNKKKFIYIKNNEKQRQEEKDYIYMNNLIFYLLVLQDDGVLEGDSEA